MGILPAWVGKSPHPSNSRVHISVLNPDYQINCNDHQKHVFVIQMIKESFMMISKPHRRVRCDPVGRRTAQPRAHWRPETSPLYPIVISIETSIYESIDLVRKFENRKGNFSLNLEKWLFSLRKSAVQQSFVDLLTSFIFTFPVVCLSPWSHLHLSPSYHVLDHIFTESLSSGDNNDREEYLQKDKYKGKDTHTQTNTKCF